jgi:hypothetical protein
MKYQVVREEHGTKITLMQCDFEDKDHFKLIAKNPQYIILYNGKDVTKKYRAGANKK